MGTVSNRHVLQDKDILQKLRDVVEEVTGIDPDDVTPDKDFANDLCIGSLEQIEILIIAEGKYGTRFDDVHLANIKTVQDVIELVKNAHAT